MPVPKEFSDRIGDVAIRSSKFRTRIGDWAKRWEECEKVVVTFEDDVVVEIEPGDFVTLPSAQQTLVREAPSTTGGC